MRTIASLFFFSLLLGATFAKADDATSIIESILNVDRALEEEIKSDIAEAKDKKAQLKNQISDYVKNTAQELKDALSDKVDKLREIDEAYKAQEYSDRKRAMEEWKKLVQGINQTKAAWETEKANKMEQEKQKIRDLLNQLKTAYEKKKEMKAAEKEKEKEQFRQAWQKVLDKYKDIQWRLNDSSNASKERRREKLESMRATLNEMKAIITQQKEARDQKQQERRDEYENRVNQIKNDLKAKKNDLDALEEELKQKYAQYMEKQNDLKGTVQSALKESVKASVVMEIGDNLQDTLDKAAVKEALSEVKGEKRNNVTAVPKATVLDDITGVSAWQTVTWMLLALSILLGIALVAMIVYQVAQRSKYQNLDHPHERTPIARPVSSPGYVDEMKPATPMAAGPVVPAGAAGPVVPAGDVQQF